MFRCDTCPRPPIQWAPGCPGWTRRRGEIFGRHNFCPNYTWFDWKVGRLSSARCASTMPLPFVPSPPPVHVFRLIWHVIPYEDHLRTTWEHQYAIEFQMWEVIMFFDVVQCSSYSMIYSTIFDFPTWHQDRLHIILHENTQPISSSVHVVAAPTMHRAGCRNRPLSQKRVGVSPA